MTPLPVAALAITLGAAIGSFMSVVAARVPPLVLSSPEGKVRLTRLFSTLSWPGSHCSSCQASVRWWDNIPIFSYLLLRGRCRSCHAAYGGKYVLLEAGGAAAGLASVTLYGWSAQGALCFLFLSLLAVLSAIDLAEMLLPDVLVFPLLPLGLAYQTWYGEGAMSACLGALAAFAVMWAIGAFASGLVVMSAFLLAGKSETKQPLPFGPFLALSAAVFVLVPQAAAALAGLFAY